DGEQNDKVVFFDETTRRIHQFDMQHMTHDRSLSVDSPGAKHYVLFHQQGNYIVDLTDKHLTVFGANTTAHDPIHFEGKPVSAAFSPELGYLVIYDDLQSVGVIKLSADGQVAGAHVFGSELADGVSISAGEILPDGHLALAMTEGSVYLVDL